MAQVRSLSLASELKGLTAKSRPFHSLSEVSGMVKVPSYLYSTPYNMIRTYGTRVGYDQQCARNCFIIGFVLLFLFFLVNKLM